MKKNLNFLTCIFLLLACSPKQPTETQTSTEVTLDSVNSQSEIVLAEEPESKPVMNEKEAGKISLDEANLIQFPFATQYTTQLVFFENGKVEHVKKMNDEKNVGTWRLTGSKIQVAFGQDTATFSIYSFKEDELILVTADEFGGKLFGEVRQDYGDYSGLYYISLHRMIFSAPYSDGQVSGGWNARDGGCSFESGGQFQYGAADCGASGNWEFDGENFTIELTQKECGWSDPFDTRLKVIGLARGLMIVENSKGEIETFTR
jgi:hypothetical protein